ncbi:MAG: hypothetical protein KJ072_13965 [Verrucomicrobia bacterium]|nr:hypothetical protein [Verrucomicrobiota bacterium]
MLEAINLTKKFNSHVAVNPLNLRIAPGETFALLGPNGAGWIGMLALAGLVGVWTQRQLRPGQIAA